MTALSLCALLAAIPNDAWVGEARVRLDVSVQAISTVPPNYVVPVTIDHARWVTQGLAAANGADLTVAVLPDAGVVERLPVTLDLQTSTNASDTRLMVRLPRAMPAGTSLDFSVFLGVLDGGTLGGPDPVFLFADGFESGDFSRWVVPPGSPSLLVAPMGPDGGFAALSRPLGAFALQQQLFAAMSTLPDDVELTGLVKMSAPDVAQFGWFMRALPPPSDTSLNFGPDGFSGANRWALGYRQGGGFTRDTTTTLLVPPGVWQRFTYSAIGSGHRGCSESLCMPTTGFQASGLGPVPDGGIGWGRFFLNGDNAPDGGRDIIFDDIRVRPLIATEPMAIASGVVLGDGVPCAPGDQCRLGQCAVSGFCPVPDAGPADAGPADAGIPDAGTADAGTADAGAPDAGIADAGTADAGSNDSGIDSGTPDAGTPDGGTSDSGTPDAGSSDSGSIDSGSIDSGTSDSGTGDAGPVEVDAGAPDSGTADAGLHDGGVMLPDAGLPGELVVSCDCSSSSAGVWFWAVLLVGAFRRRAR